jgi:hypothetical protein
MIVASGRGAISGELHPGGGISEVREVSDARRLYHGNST